MLFLREVEGFGNRQNQLAKNEKKKQAWDPYQNVILHISMASQISSSVKEEKKAIPSQIHPIPTPNPHNRQGAVSLFIQT